MPRNEGRETFSLTDVIPRQPSRPLERHRAASRSAAEVEGARHRTRPRGASAPTIGSPEAQIQARDQGDGPRRHPPADPPPRGDGQNPPNLQTPASRQPRTGPCQKRAPSSPTGRATRLRLDPGPRGSSTRERVTLRLSNPGRWAQSDRRIDQSAFRARMKRASLFLRTRFLAAFFARLMERFNFAIFPFHWALRAARDK